MQSAPEEKHISIKMNDEFITRLDDIAHMAKRSRIHIIKNFIEVGVEELEKHQIIRFFQLGIYARDLSESIKNKANLSSADPVAGDRPIPIRLDENFIDRLDTLANKAGLSRHQLMKNIIRVGLVESERISKVGILQLIVLLRDLPESFRKICKKGEAALKATEK